MPTKFQLGQNVYVPASKVDRSDHPYALCKARVEAQSERRRTATIELGNNTIIDVATKHLRADIGILIVQAGNLTIDDETLLDPIAKSILHYLRLLVPEDEVRRVVIRTSAELRVLWQRDHAAYHHLILVGHCDGKSLLLVEGESITGIELADLLGAPQAVRPKQILALACHAGRAAFAKPVSAAQACAALAGPYNKLHGAAAAQFCQTLFSHDLLRGTSPAVAFRNAAAAQATATGFRRWVGGWLQR